MRHQNNILRQCCNMSGPPVMQSDHEEAVEQSDIHSKARHLHGYKMQNKKYWKYIVHLLHHIGMIGIKCAQISCDCFRCQFIDCIQLTLENPRTIQFLRVLLTK
ncbi:hypothetical protein L798_00197 [Zootermopsis nevadensis]|uniref:Uncharacterized protein n=1 Tax=Zootermopsis nevadensis TaxID=136037 RepID=A0A067QWB4_ZOONE|nr:hypothetical protein L798_00197 [Zootermopsis nevadensis]